MSSSLRGRVLLLTLLVSSGSSLALEIGLGGTNTFRYGWGSIRESTTGDDIDRIYREDMLDVDFTWNSFRLNTAAAMLHPAELPDTRTEADRIKELALLRRSLSWSGPVDVSLGHVWTTFGSGMALDLYRDDALQNPLLLNNQSDETPTTWDSRVDGALVTYYGDLASIKAVYGESDYTGTVTGLNLESQLSFMMLGGSLVRAEEIPSDMATSTPELMDLVSRELYAETSLAGIDLGFTHVDQVRKDDGPVNAGQGGLASYATLGTSLFDWYVQAEYKYYRFAQKDLYHHNPPIVQQEIPTRLIARKRRLNDYSDEVGFQLMLDRYFDGGQELSFSAAVASRIDDSLMPKFEERLAAYQEYVAGLKLESESGRHTRLAAAYTEETSGQVLSSGQEVGGGHWYRKLGFGVSHFRELPVIGPFDFNVEVMNKEDLEADESHKALLVYMDLVPFRDLSFNLTMDYEEESEDQQDWIASTELRYDFDTAGNMHHALTLFAGRLRKGLVCSSGNCREVPAFDGLKLTLISQF